MESEKGKLKCECKCENAVGASENIRILLLNSNRRRKRKKKGVKEGRRKRQSEVVRWTNNMAHGNGSATFYLHSLNN